MLNIDDTANPVVAQVPISEVTIGGIYRYNSKYYMRTSATQANLTDATTVNIATTTLVERVGALLQILPYIAPTP